MHLLGTEFFNFLLAKPVNPKGNQPWIFTGRTDAEAESLVLWQYNGKGPDVGKDWRQEEKEVAENKMVRWHQWLNGHESEQTPGNSEGQGSLVCCSLWGGQESDMTWRLNSNNLPFESPIKENSRPNILEMLTLIQRKKKSSSKVSYAYLSVLLPQSKQNKTTN